MSEYKWKCPYCDKAGTEKWNKSCYYQLVAHLAHEHLEIAFSDLIKRFSDSNKKHLINAHWEFFNSSIIDDPIS